MSLADGWRRWRHALKAALPFVRRREYRILQRKYAALIEAADGAATPAAQARLMALKPPPAVLGGEVCLFVTHAPQAALKPHVVAHLGHLLAAGWQVVLVINSDLPAAAFSVELRLLGALTALLVRENRGFDFAGWAHALSLCGFAAGCSRLLLVNDSIVGPLDAAAFARLTARLRASRADVVGLTESRARAPHLQSYFLAFNAAALRHPAWQALFRRVLNWPDKSQVVDIYETRLTGLLSAAGLRCEALFPALTSDPLGSDDTSQRWRALIDAGLPYVKTRVLDALPAAERARYEAAAAPAALSWRDDQRSSPR